MDETMNTELEITTEVSEVEDVNLEITIDEDSYVPSKGFMAFVVGSMVAVAVGATIAINRHKKKKAAAREEGEIDESLNDEEAIPVEAEEVSVKETEEKSSGEK